MTSCVRTKFVNPPFIKSLKKLTAGGETQIVPEPLLTDSRCAQGQEENTTSEYSNDLLMNA